MTPTWNQKAAEQDTLARIGATLIQIQRTERLINYCVQVLLPKDDLSTLFPLGGRRPTLGPLVQKLKNHNSIADDFRDTLESFLIERNRFVHDLEFLPNWTLLSEQGIATANEYLDRLNILEREVDQAFTKFYRSHKPGSTFQLRG